MARRSVPAKSRSRRPKRQALLVLGMHRSGTSAVAGVMARLGAKNPRSLMAPAKDNPTGFSESIELQRFHDQILRSAGSRWSDWGPFNPDWSGSTVAEQFSDLLPQLIEDEFGDAPMLLIKDPRICRFLPFWLQVLERMRIEPLFVIPVRNPLEVAGSLEERNDFSPAHSMLIWLRHVLEAESETRRGTRSLIGYEQLLRDWRAQAKKIATDLSIRWPGWSSAVEVEIDDYLREELRHHVVEEKAIGANREIRQWVGAAYAALGDLIAGQGAAGDAQRVLDEVKRDFDRAGAMFAVVMRQQENKLDAARSEAANLKKVSQDLASKVSDLQASSQVGVAGLEVKAKLLAQQVAELTQAVSKLTAENLAKATRVGELGARLQNAEQARDAAAKQLAAQAAEIAAKIRIAADAAVRDKERIAAHEATIKQLVAQGAERSASIDKLNAEIKAREQALMDAQGAHARELSAHAKARDGLVAQKAAAEQLAARLVELKQKNEDAVAAQKAKVNQLSSRVAELDRVNRKLKAGNDEKARSIAARFRELATLTKMLEERERAGAEPDDAQRQLRGAPSLAAIRKALAR